MKIFVIYLTTALCIYVCMFVHAGSAAKYACPFLCGKEKKWVCLLTDIDTL